jgi:hypothetical protein
MDRAHAHLRLRGGRREEGRRLLPRKSRWWEWEWEWEARSGGAVLWAHVPNISSSRAGSLSSLAWGSGGSHENGECEWEWDGMEPTGSRCLTESRYGPLLACVWFVSLWLERDGMDHLFFFNDIRVRRHILLVLINIRNFYFRVLGFLVILSFFQLISFSSVFPKPLSETLTRSSDGRNPVQLTVPC